MKFARDAVLESTVSSDFSQVEPAALILPLRIGPNRTGTWMPTLRFDAELLTAENLNWATGCWQIIVWTTAVEARAAAHALRLIDQTISFEVMILQGGEGLLLSRMHQRDQPHAQILVSDRRAIKTPLVGSWTLSHAQATQMADVDMTSAEVRANALSALFKKESLGVEVASVISRALSGDTDLSNIDAICADRIRDKIAQVCGDDVAQAISDRQVDQRVAAIRERIEGTIDILTEEVAYDLMSSDRI